ncbi:antibiotic biosynthesis monooxygenase [Amaricoccus macauensis]|uniref:antibiotic biosynthesis monooxygenase n=1 Tax=Amaricoccus macauensis TaxID=57001 RepID=UPI003C7C021F
MFVQIVTIEIMPGARDAFLEAMQANCKGSRAEPGNLRFDILGDPEDPNRFTIYEVFESAEALDHHRKTAHYATCRQRIDPITVAGSKQYYDAVLIDERQS